MGQLCFMKTNFSLSDFDFTLPDDLIAQHPAVQRSASRLLDGRSGAMVDRRFADLPDLLLPGDLLVFNDTKVVKARLFGQKVSGGKLELLIERVLSPQLDAGHEVAAHMKVSKKPLPGAVLQMEGGFTATLLSLKRYSGPLSSGQRLSSVAVKPPSI
jgi:S-adenosylmethionine:tRNA ribosyltransferase-isomerase